jgi:hypothetical protein
MLAPRTFGVFGEGVVTLLPDIFGFSDQLSGSAEID